MADLTVECWEWTIPTPTGLWYRSIVAVGNGLFVTAEIDVTTLRRIRQASDVGAREVVVVLMDHGRFKRPDFVNIADLTGLRSDRSVGLLHIDTAHSQLSLRIPNRERLDTITSELRGHLKALSVKADQ